MSPFASRVSPGAPPGLGSPRPLAGGTPMRRMGLIAVAAALVAAPFAAGAALPQPIASAVANPARAADVKSDVRRKGPELLAFAEVKPGQKVYDLIPGAGYFTRLFSLTVGPS